jgi:hypothetical protein
VLKRYSREAMLSRESADLRSSADGIRSTVEMIDHLTDTERHQVRLATFSAYCRARQPEYVIRITDRAGTSITLVALVAVVIAASNLFLRLAPDGSTVAVVPHYIVLAVALGAGGGWVSRHVLADLWKGRQRVGADGNYYPFIGAMLLAVLAVAGPPAVLVGVGLGVPARQWTPLAYAVALPSFLIGLSGQIVLGRVSLLIETALSPQRRQRPLDVTTLWLASLTAQTASSRMKWSNAAQIRRLRRSIQSAAWSIEHDRTVAYRTRIWEIQLRSSLTEDQQKLALLLRAHDRAFVTIKTYGDYERIYASLKAGLLAAAVGDWDALLTNATETGRFGTAARLSRVFGPFLLFLLFAIIVGWLPGVDQQSAGSARVLLVIAAILSVVPGGPGISDTVRATMEKALPWHGH